MPIPLIEGASPTGARDINGAELRIAVSRVGEVSDPVLAGAFGGC